MVKESQGKRFCSCIKKVRKSFKNPRGSKESAAIGVCVKSVLQTKGKTLRRFTCGKKPKVITQKMKK
jgi:hypothetical protein